MNATIWRQVANNTHVLNVCSGNLMSFEIPKEAFDYLVENWRRPELDLEDDTQKLFSEYGQPNSRLCRSNLNSLGMEFGFPTMVNIEINRRCSLECLHCYIGKKDLKSHDLSIFEKMSSEDIETLFDDLHKLGVFVLVFTGGEPFINSRLQQLIEMTDNKGFLIEIFSNLQVLPKWFREIKFLNSLIGRVQASVYSDNPEVHDKITTVKGSHARTLENIGWLIENGCYVEVATPLMVHNYHTWQSTKEYFADKGIKQDFSWPIVDEYYSEKTDKKSLNISPEQFGRFVSSNPDFLLKVDFDDPEQPICEAGKSVFSISANGEVFPCSQLPFPVGNISTQRISEIYNSPGMGRFRELKNKHAGLQYAYNYCIGTNYSETGDPLVQPQFLLDSIQATSEQE